MTENSNATPKSQTLDWKRALRKAAIITLLLTPILWSPLNRSLFNAVLFGPAAYSPEEYSRHKSIGGIATEDVYLKASDGKTIHGWMVKNPKASVTVLMSHGICGNVSYMTDLMALFLQAGTSVFVYDYEGYGRSEGKPAVETCCDDARTAYKYLVSAQGVDPSKLLLFGESFGTGIATNLSSKEKCAGIILQSPFISLRHRAIEIFAAEALYPQSFYPENALDNGAILVKPHAPLLVIGGVEDPILPVKHADRLAAMAVEPKTYVRIDGVGHTGDPRLLRAPQYLAGVKKFLASLTSRTTMVSLVDNRN